MSRESEKSRHDWYPKLSIVLKVITFFGWFPVLAPSVCTGFATPFLVASEFVGLAMWKQLTRCPTSGDFKTREDKNLCTSSFLQSVSLWYSALAVIATREKYYSYILRNGNKVKQVFKSVVWNLHTINPKSYIWIYLTHEFNYQWHSFVDI